MRGAVWISIGCVPLLIFFRSCMWLRMLFWWPCVLCMWCLAWLEWPRVLCVHAGAAIRFCWYSRKEISHSSARSRPITSALASMALQGRHLSLLSAEANFARSHSGRQACFFFLNFIFIYNRFFYYYYIYMFLLLFCYMLLYIYIFL